MSPVTTRSDDGLRRAGRPAFVAPLAWGLCLVYALLWLGTAMQYVGQGDWSSPLVGLLQFGYALVGALVAIREPRNIVGWLLLAIATSIATKNLVDAYVSQLDRPFVVPVAWTGGLLASLGLYLIAFPLPLLFPDGRLPSPRWRSVAWLGACWLACSLVTAAFGPWPLEVASPEPIANPLAVAGVAGAVVTALSRVSVVLFTLGSALSIASLLVRLRRARGRQRQQVKWFVFVAALALGGLLISQLETVAPGLDWAHQVSPIGWFIALLLFSVGIPAAVGIAILRHRLYDIDLVVKRTLVYGLLTLTLGAVYLGSVLGLRLLLDPLAGDSDLAVAASTLAVAALFRPVRTRIQHVVDRRFYRSKYDAARIVEVFAGRLRHEVDLAAVTTDLEGVVRTSMQPTHVSLWLRGSS